ncbi:hypothetical protein DFH08DRAFT_806285 [Mycena albidolilacea]|uniref:Uncharacterized protein n=1 Tax=Mycena albidolilacea TaxID=1033008 RepID=A0AAD7A8W9_9AGAR|nr:hypothetical protein DFH08DRAFT_806285 [Mycena albidolilacea]
MGATTRGRELLLPTVQWAENGALAQGRPHCILMAFRPKPVLRLLSTPGHTWTLADPAKVYSRLDHVIHNLTLDHVEPYSDPWETRGSRVSGAVSHEPFDLIDADKMGNGSLYWSQVLRKVATEGCSLLRDSAHLERGQLLRADPAEASQPISAKACQIWTQVAPEAVKMQCLGQMQPTLVWTAGVDAPKCVALNNELVRGVMDYCTGFFMSWGNQSILVQPRLDASYEVVEDSSVGFTG